MNREKSLNAAMRLRWPTEARWNADLKYMLDRLRPIFFEDDAEDLEEFAFEQMAWAARDGLVLDQVINNCIRSASGTQFPRKK